LYDLTELYKPQSHYMVSYRILYNQMLTSMVSGFLIYVTKYESPVTTSHPLGFLGYDRSPISRYDINILYVLLY